MGLGDAKCSHPSEKQSGVCPEPQKEIPPAGDPMRVHLRVCPKRSLEMGMGISPSQDVRKRVKKQK